MEAILQLVMEGLGGCSSVLEICRDHLQERVLRGELAQSQADELLDAIGASLTERRRILLEGARRECLRLIETIPIVTGEAFSKLEDRVRTLEEGGRRNPA